MKFTGKAEEVATQLVNLFKHGDPGQALSHLFLRDGGRHYCGWSWNNQLLTIMMGYSDAMGYKQWLAKGRTVKKGEKAFYILAPLTCKGERNNNGTKEQYTFIRGFRGTPVFGYEQTEGEPIIYENDEYISGLPLFEVAKNWGITVGSYDGSRSNAAGYFSPTKMSIMLGVRNLSTWLHELVHAAEHKIGILTAQNYAEQKLETEIVAEFGSTVLAHCLGMHDDADNGGCWQYIKRYAEGYHKDPAECALRLIDRTCKAVNYILHSNEELVENDVSAELVTT